MLLISDANILIDVDTAGFLEEMFSLPIAFAIPDVLFVQELEAQHPELPEYGLQILNLDEKTVAEAIKLRQKYRLPGQNDLFALALAKQKICPLLTGDKDLRNAAEAETVTVRGIIWLIGQMFERKLITIEQVENAYESMRNAGRRLPWDEVDKQIKRFRKI